MSQTLHRDQQQSFEIALHFLSCVFLCCIRIYWAWRYASDGYSRESRVCCWPFNSELLIRHWGTLGRGRGPPKWSKLTGDDPNHLLCPPYSYKSLPLYESRKLYHFPVSMMGAVMRLLLFTSLHHLQSPDTSPIVIILYAYIQTHSPAQWGALPGSNRHCTYTTDYWRIHGQQCNELEACSPNISIPGTD